MPSVSGPGRAGAMGLLGQSAVRRTSGTRRILTPEAGHGRPKPAFLPAPIGLPLSTGYPQPSGIMLVGEPYWRREPPDQATVEGCYGTGKEGWLPLPELIESFGLLGCDVVEMVLADQDGWDRYAAASWLNIRRWLDANPQDELADEMRAELTSGPARYARYRREYLGWGVFALMDR